jgi:tetratricopeptide (TPR) repeat protein
MRALVFPDQSLQRYAGRFVWLSLDIDQSTNAPFLARNPVPATPSFYIFNPHTEMVALLWRGTATVSQLHKILEDGERAVMGRTRGADRELAHADMLFGQKKYAEAAAAYQAVIANAPPAWKRRGRAIESAVSALSTAHDFAACARFGRDTFSKSGPTTTGLHALIAGFGCALRMDETHSERAALLESFRILGSGAVDDVSVTLGPDDAAALYRFLAGERRRAKDDAGRKQRLMEMAQYLEAQAAAAKTSEGRMALDNNRLYAYRDLGALEKAIPMLEASERDFPAEATPPARLAGVYRDLKRYDEALAASDRSLAKAYGFQRLSALRSRAFIHAARGDKDAARRTFEEAIRVAESLPEGQRDQWAIDDLKKSLKELN